jgi:hypothetical protein
MGERRGTCRILVGRPDGKRPIGRPRRRWEDTVKVDLFKNWDGQVWTGLIWLRYRDR